MFTLKNFKQTGAAVLLAGVVLLGLTLFASASTLKEVADSTYKFYIDGRPGCSAVAVSETKLATAAHCVASGTDYSIAVQKLGPNFELISMEIAYTDVIRTIKDKDVALLEIRDGRLPVFVDVADPAKVDLQFGDPLITVGYPMAIDLTMTRGEFTGLVPLPNLPSKGGFYKTTIPVTGGNSGGGLYAQTEVRFSTEGGGEFIQEYELIGLTTAAYQHVSFMSYFSNVNSLDEVLKNLLNTAPKYEGAGTETGGIVNPADSR